jgi:hypothetical protein
MQLLIQAANAIREMLDFRRFMRRKISIDIWQ